MTFTNEERREVAQKLRDAATECYNYGVLESDVLNILGVYTTDSACLVSSDSVMDVAYLIDRPTCHDTEERVNSFTCSSCGFREGKIMFNPFTYSFREIKPDWNYCPNCGAEVQE